MSSSLDLLLPAASQPSPSTRNLYVWVDEDRTDQLRDSIRRLQRASGYFPDEQGSDPLDFLFDTLFEDGMPMRFYIANTSLVMGRVMITLRPVLTEGRAWPFPPGRSICVQGSWPVGVPQPEFRVRRVLEISDAACRPFEREMEVFTYRADPDHRTRRTDNVLTPDLVASLPLISRVTAERLENWTDFLAWKRNLVREKSVGLRYVGWQLKERSVLFAVVAPDAAALEAAFRSLRRQQIAAFDLKVSTDAWILKLDEQVGRLRAYELGEAQSPRRLQPYDKLDQCPWESPLVAELEIDLSEDALNRVQAAEDREEFEAELRKEVPPEGFVSVSITGDMALIGRHERALRDLRDQGGYAPYLSAYLFDVTGANVPKCIPEIASWHRQDLNDSQREAVKKILAAPDLCLVQGPPGTGKTTVIAEAIYQAVRAGKKVLVASQANTAVDNALERLGNVPDIRAIRLGKSKKFSDGGQEFAEDRVLGRYYGTIAEACESRHLARWDADDRRANLLKPWLERARLARADHAPQHQLLQDLRPKRVDLERAVRGEEARLQELRFENESRAARRDRLDSLRALLDGREATCPIDILLPEAAEVIAAGDCLAQAGLAGFQSLLDWEASPRDRATMLSDTIRHWREVVAAREVLGRDAARLRARGDGALRDAVVEVRLRGVDSELAAVEKQLESDSLALERWKALRTERKELLQSSGGLDRGFYEGLLRNAKAVLQAPRAAEAFAHVSAVLQAIVAVAPRFEAATKALRGRVEQALLQTQPLPLDQATVTAREQALKSHDREVAAAESALARRQDVLNALAREHADARAPGAPTFDGLLEATEKQLSALEQRQRESRADRQTWEPLLRDWVNSLRSEDQRRSDHPHFIRTYLRQCNVVAITCNESSRTLEESSHTHFDIAIVDEVSKATPTELLLPLMRARTAVLVGDHRQLPPLFKEGHEAVTWADEVPEDESTARTALTKDNLRRFEKMVTASLFKEHFEKAPDAIKARLEVQYRMHPQIMKAVNHFYDRRLTCGLADPDRDRAHGLDLRAHDGKPMVTPATHIAWIDTAVDPAGRPVEEDQSERGEPLRTNRLEAVLIADALARMDDEAARKGWSKERRLKVGVVSFYANQLRMIRDQIRVRTGGQAWKALEVEINTVIRYQGKEKAIVLVSLVRNRPKHLSGRANVAQYQFINVAFSRAQCLLMVFGAKQMFENYEVELPNMDSTGSKKRLVYRDILQQLARDGHLFPAERLMSPAAYAQKGTHPASRGRRS